MSNTHHADHVQMLIDRYRSVGMKPFETLNKETQKEIDCAEVGSILSLDVVKEIYEMAKLNVDKTEQCHDFIVSKATVLMGLLSTVLMAFVSALYALMRAEQPDKIAVICIGAAIILTGVSLFLLVFGVISGNRIHTTGETVDTFTSDDIISWYKKIPEQDRDKAFMLLKSLTLKDSSDKNMQLLERVSGCYNRAVRLFICGITLIGVSFFILQLTF